MKARIATTLTTVLMALAGLIAAQVVGAIWWPPRGGITLILIGLTVSLILAALAPKLFHSRASLVASGIGAMIACYFAAATAELLPPGSVEWMLKGGLYGACFGLPVAALLSPLGWIGLRSAGDEQSGTKKEIGSSTRAASDSLK